MTGVSISRLRCEYLDAPLGIDERIPRLSWQLDSERRGARQIAYRIRVASSPGKLEHDEADRWDSGRVEGDQTTHIVYAGTPLRSRDACHWLVEVWDETEAVVRSSPSLWTMGLLEKSDWTAHWIAAGPEIIRRDPQAVAPTLTQSGTPAVFRREFSLPATVKHATLYASARGLVEILANGRRVSDDPRVDGLRQAHPISHLRCHGAVPRWS